MTTHTKPMFTVRGYLRHTTRKKRPVPPKKMLVKEMRKLIDRVNVETKNFPEPFQSLPRTLLKVLCTIPKRMRLANLVAKWAPADFQPLFEWMKGVPTIVRDGVTAPLWEDFERSPRVHALPLEGNYPVLKRARGRLECDYGWLPFAAHHLPRVFTLRAQEYHQELTWLFALSSCEVLNNLARKGPARNSRSLRIRLRIFYRALGHLIQWFSLVKPAGQPKTLLSLLEEIFALKIKPITSKGNTKKSQNCERPADVTSLLNELHAQDADCLTSITKSIPNRKGTYTVLSSSDRIWRNKNLPQLSGEYLLRSRPRSLKGVRRTLLIGICVLCLIVCQEGIHLWDAMFRNKTPRTSDGTGISQYLQLDSGDILADDDLTFPFIAANSSYLRIEMFGIENPNANEIGKVSIGIADGDIEARESFTCFPGQVNTFKLDFAPEEWGSNPYAPEVNATVYNLTIPAEIAPAIQSISIQPVIVASGYGEVLTTDLEPRIHNFTAGGPISVMFCGGIMDFGLTYIALDAGTPDEIILKDPIDGIDLSIPFMLASSVATGTEVMQFDVNVRPGPHRLAVQGNNGTYIFDVLNTNADWDADGVDDTVEYNLGKSNPMIDPWRTNIFGMLEEEMPCWTLTTPELDPENGYPFGWVRGQVKFFISDVLADWGYPLDLTLECPFGLYTNFSLDANPIEENVTLFGFNTASEEIIQATLPTGEKMNIPANNFNAWPEHYLARLTTGEHTLEYVRRYDILDRPQLNLRIDNQYVVIIDRAIYPNSAADFGDFDGLPDDEDPSPEASLTLEKGTILQVTVPVDQNAQEDYLIEFYVKRPTLAPDVEKLLLGEQVMNWQDSVTVTIRPTLRIFGPGNAGRAEKQGWWDLEGQDYWNSLAELSQFFEKPVKSCNVVATDGNGVQHLEYSTINVKFDGECDVLPLVGDLNAQGYYHLIFGDVAGETITFGPLSYPYDSPAFQDNCIDIRADLLWCVLENNEVTGELTPLGWYDMDQDVTIQSISVKAFSETNYVVARPTSAINSRVLLEYTKDNSVPISVNKQTPAEGRTGIDDILRSEIIGEGHDVRYLPSYFYLDDNTTTWGVAERAMYDYHREYFSGFADFTAIPEGQIPTGWGYDIPSNPYEVWMHVTDSLWGKDHAFQFFDLGSPGIQEHVGTWTSIPDIRAGSVAFNLSIGTSGEGFNFGLQHAGEDENVLIAQFVITGKNLLSLQRGGNSWTYLPIPEIIPESYHSIKIDYDLDSPQGGGTFDVTYDGTKVCTNWQLADGDIPPNRLFFNTSQTATALCTAAIDEVSIQARQAPLMLNHSAVTYLCSTQRHLDLLNKINKSIYFDARTNEQFLFYGGNDFSRLSPGSLIDSQQSSKWSVTPASSIRIARNIVCHGNVMQVESGSIERLFSSPASNGTTGFSFNLPSDAQLTMRYRDANQQDVLVFRTTSGYLEYRNGTQDWIKICKIWPEWFSLLVDFNLPENSVEINTGGVWISFHNNLILGNPSATSINSLVIEKEARSLGCYFDDFSADWEPSTDSDLKSLTYLEVHSGDLIQRVASSIVNDQYSRRYNTADTALEGDEQTLFTTQYSDSLYEHARAEVSGIPLLVQLIRTQTATSGNFDFLDALNITYGYAPDLNLVSIPWHNSIQWVLGNVPPGVVYRNEFFLEVPNWLLGQLGTPTVNFDLNVGDLTFVSIDNRIRECNPLDMLVPLDLVSSYTEPIFIRSSPSIAGDPPVGPSPAGHDITEIMAMYQACVRIMRSITLDRFNKQKQQILPELLSKYPDLLNLIILDPELRKGSIAGYIEQPDPDILLWGTVPASSLPAEGTFKKVMELMELAEKGEESWERLWNTPNDQFVGPWTLSPFFNPQDFWQPNTRWDETTGDCQLFHASGTKRQAWQLSMWVDIVDADFSQAWKAGKISSELKTDLKNYYGKPEIINVNPPGQIPKNEIRWKIIGLNPTTGLPLDGSKLRADYIPKAYRDQIHPCAFKVLSGNFKDPPTREIPGVAGTRSGAAVKSIPVPVNFYWKYEMTLQFAQRRLATYPLLKYMYEQKPVGNTPASAPQMDLGDGQIATINPSMVKYASIFNAPAYPPSAVCTVDDLVKQGVNPSIIQELKSGGTVDDLMIQYNCIDAQGKVHDTIKISAILINNFVYATSLGWKNDPQFNVVGARPATIFQGGATTLWIQNCAVHLLSHLYTTLINIACGRSKFYKKSDFPMISDAFWQELDQAVDKKTKVFTEANELGRLLAQSDLINRECWSIQGPGKRQAVSRIIRHEPLMGPDVERLYSGSNFFKAWDICPFIKLLLTMYPTDENRLKFVQFLAPSTGGSSVPFPGGPQWFKSFWTKVSILSQALTPMRDLGREKIKYYWNGELKFVGTSARALPIEAEWKLENEVTRLLCNIDDKIVVFRKSYRPSTRKEGTDRSDPQFLAFNEFILQQTKAKNNLFQSALPEIQEGFKNLGIPIPRSPEELITLVLTMNGWSEEYSRVFLAEFHSREGEGSVKHNPLPFLTFWETSEIARKVTEFRKTGIWNLDPMLQGQGTWRDVQIIMNKFWKMTMGDLIGQISLGKKTSITKTEWILQGMGQEIDVKFGYDERGRLVSKVYLLPPEGAPQDTPPFLLGERVMAVDGEVTRSLEKEFDRKLAGRQSAQVWWNGRRVWLSWKAFLEMNLKQLWKWNFIQQKQEVVKKVESGDVMAWLQRYKHSGRFPMEFKATEEVEVGRLLQQLGAIDKQNPELIPFVIVNGQKAPLDVIIHVGDSVYVSHTSCGGGTWIADQQIPLPDLPPGDPRLYASPDVEGFEGSDFETLPPGYKFQRNLYGMQSVARRWAVNWYADRCVERLTWWNLQDALADILGATQLAQLDLDYLGEIEAGRPLWSSETIGNYWRARWGVVDQSIVTILTSLLLLSSALQRGATSGQASVSTIGYAISAGAVEAFQINALVRSIRANRAWRAAGGEIFDVTNYRPVAKLSLSSFAVPLLIDIVTTFWSGWDYAAALMAQGTSRDLAISAAVMKFLPPILIEAVVDLVVQYAISYLVSGTTALVASSSAVGLVVGMVISTVVVIVWQAILDWIDATWYPNDPSIFLDSGRQILDITEPILKHGGMRTGDEVTYSISFKNNGLNSFWFRQRAAVGGAGLESGTGAAWEQARHYTLSENYFGSLTDFPWYGTYEDTSDVASWLSNYGNRIWLPGQAESKWATNGWAGSNGGEWPYFDEWHNAGRYYPDESLNLAPDEYGVDGDTDKPADWDIFVHRCPVLEASTQLHLYVQNQLEYYYNSIQYPGRRETPPTVTQDYLFGDANGDGYINPLYERPMRVLEGTLGEFLSHCEEVEVPTTLSDYWMNFTEAIRSYQFYDAANVAEDLISAAETRAGIPERQFNALLPTLADPMTWVDPSLSILNLYGPANNPWISTLLSAQLAANYYLLNAPSGAAWDSYLGTSTLSNLFAAGWRAATPGIGTIYRQDFDTIEETKIPPEWHANAGWPEEYNAPLHLGVQDGRLTLDDHATPEACEAWVDVGSLYKGSISWESQLNIIRTNHWAVPAMAQKYAQMRLVQTLPGGGWVDVMAVEMKIDIASWGDEVRIYTNGQLVGSLPVSHYPLSPGTGSNMWRYYTQELSFHLSFDTTANTCSIVIDGEGVTSTRLDGIPLLIPVVPNQFRVRTGYLEGGGWNDAYSLYLDNFRVECWDWHGGNLNGQSRTLPANQLLVPLSWVATAAQSFRYINETRNALRHMPIRVNVKALPSWTSTLVLEPGQSFAGTIAFALAGEGDNPTCKWTLQGPEGWETWPVEGTSRLWSLPSSSNPLAFTLETPKSALAGIYYLTLYVTIIDGPFAGNVTYLTRFPVRVRYNTSLGIDLPGFSNPLSFGQLYKWGLLENLGSIPQRTYITIDTTLPGGQYLFGDRFSIVSRWDFPNTASGFHVESGPGMLALQANSLMLFTLNPGTATFGKDTRCALVPGDVIKIRYRSTVTAPVSLNAGEIFALNFTGDVYSETTFTITGFPDLMEVEISGNFRSGEFVSIDYLEIAKSIDRHEPLAEFFFPWTTSSLETYGWSLSLGASSATMSFIREVLDATYVYQGDSAGDYETQSYIQIGGGDQYRGLVQLPSMPEVLRDYASFANMQRYLLLRPDSTPTLGNLTLWECEWNWNAGNSLTWDSQPPLADWWHDNASLAENVLGPAYAGWYLWDITGLRNTTACIRASASESWTFHSEDTVNPPLVVYVIPKVGFENGSLVIQTDQPAGEDIILTYKFDPLFGNVTLRPGDKVWVSFDTNSTAPVELTLSFTGQVSQTYTLSEGSSNLGFTIREFTYTGVEANVSMATLRCHFALPTESFQLNFLGLYRYQPLGRSFEPAGMTGWYAETADLNDLQGYSPLYSATFDVDLDDFIPSSSFVQADTLGGHLVLETNAASETVQVTNTFGEVFVLPSATTRTRVRYNSSVPFTVAVEDAMNPANTWEHTFQSRGFWSETVVELSSIANVAKIAILSQMQDTDRVEIDYLVIESGPASAAPVDLAGGRRIVLPLNNSDGVAPCVEYWFESREVGGIDWWFSTPGTNTSFTISLLTPSKEDAIVLDFAELALHASNASQSTLLRELYGGFHHFSVRWDAQWHNYTVLLDNVPVLYTDYLAGTGILQFSSSIQEIVGIRFSVNPGGLGSHLLDGFALHGNNGYIAGSNYWPLEVLGSVQAAYLDPGTWMDLYAVAPARSPTNLAGTYSFFAAIYDATGLPLGKLSQNVEVPAYYDMSFSNLTAANFVGEPGDGFSTLLNLTSLGNTPQQFILDVEGVRDFLRVSWSGAGVQYNPVTGIYSVQLAPNTSVELTLLFDQIGAGTEIFFITATSPHNASKIPCFISTNYPPTWDTIPEDLNYVAGQGGAPGSSTYAFTWRVLDDTITYNQSSYEITCERADRSGTTSWVVVNASWASGVNITLDVSGLSIGTYLYTITVDDGRWARITDAACLVVFNDDPWLNRPNNLRFEYNHSTGPIEWVVFDAEAVDPRYMITLEGVEIANASWVASEPILVTVDQLLPRQTSYHYIITAWDGNASNAVQDEVTVSVFNEPPVLTLLTDPAEIPSYILVSDSFELRYKVVDDSVAPLFSARTWSFTCDGTLYATDSWGMQEVSEILVSIAGSAVGVGNHTFKLAVDDGLSLNAQVFGDIISVEVLYTMPEVIISSPITRFEWGQLAGPEYWTWTFTDPDVAAGAYYDINWQKQDPAYNYIPGEAGDLLQGSLRQGTTIVPFDIVAFSNAHGPGRYIFTGTFCDRLTAPRDLGIYALDVTNNIKPEFILYPSVAPYYYDGSDPSITFAVQDASTVPYSEWTPYVSCTFADDAAGFTPTFASGDGQFLAVSPLVWLEDYWPVYEGSDAPEGWPQIPEVSYRYVRDAENYRQYSFSTAIAFREPSMHSYVLLNPSAPSYLFPVSSWQTGYNNFGGLDPINCELAGSWDDSEQFNALPPTDSVQWSTITDDDTNKKLAHGDAIVPPGYWITFEDIYFSPFTSHQLRYERPLFDSDSEIYGIDFWRGLQLGTAEGYAPSWYSTCDKFGTEDASLIFQSAVPDTIIASKLFDTSPLMQAGDKVTVLFDAPVTASGNARVELWSGSSLVQTLPLYDFGNSVSGAQQVTFALSSGGIRLTEIRVVADLAAGNIFRLQKLQFTRFGYPTQVYPESESSGGGRYDITINYGGHAEPARGTWISGQPVNPISLKDLLVGADGNIFGETTFTVVVTTYDNPGEWGEWTNSSDYVFTVTVKNKRPEASFTGGTRFLRGQVTLSWNYFDLSNYGGSLSYEIYYRRTSPNPMSGFVAANPAGGSSAGLLSGSYGAISFTFSNLGYGADWPATGPFSPTSYDFKFVVMDGFHELVGDSEVLVQGTSIASIDVIGDGFDISPNLGTGWITPLSYSGAIYTGSGQLTLQANGDADWWDVPKKAPYARCGFGGGSWSISTHMTYTYLVKGGHAGLMLYYDLDNAIFWGFYRDSIWPWEDGPLELRLEFVRDQWYIDPSSPGRSEKCYGVHHYIHSGSFDPNSLRIVRDDAGYQFQCWNNGWVTAYSLPHSWFAFEIPGEGIDHGWDEFRVNSVGMFAKSWGGNSLTVNYDYLVVG